MAIKVIIADDHAVVREGLRLLLETRSDIRVIGEAKNGRDAVRQAQKLNPDIVIMDIAMPELNGIEAAQQILESVPSTQVIILSMYATREHIFRSLKSGAKGYILKESAGKEVVEAVYAVNAGRRYLSQKVMEMVVEEYINQDKMASSPLELLSSREREILQLVVEGKSSVEIADMIYISPKTVETYRSRLMKKLGTRDIPSLVRFAIQHGIISPA